MLDQAYQELYGEFGDRVGRIPGSVTVSTGPQAGVVIANSGTPDMLDLLVVTWDQSGGVSAEVELGSVTLEGLVERVQDVVDEL